MSPDELFARYQELQRYVAWTEDDARRVRTLAPILEPHFPKLIDDFYEEIERHPETRKMITGGAQQIARLKGSLRAWLHDLVTGPYDKDYVLSRWKVGLRHVEIGVSQEFTNVALSRLRRGLCEKSGLKSGQWSVAIDSLNVLLDLDLAIIGDAYQTENSRRLQMNERLAVNEKLLQGERLAAIGQMMTGLATKAATPWPAVNRVSKCSPGKSKIGPWPSI